MSNGTRRNFWLDLTLLLSFLLATTTGLLLWLVIPRELRIAFLALPRSAWRTSHICSGMVSLACAALHVVWHWDWLKALRGRRLSALPKQVRANRVTDRVMWIAFIAANVSGVLAWAMRWSDATNVVTVPGRLHAVAGIALTLLGAVHVALHRKWIASTARRHMGLGFGHSSNDAKSTANGVIGCSLFAGAKAGTCERETNVIA
jgi:hypothetical protein